MREWWLIRLGEGDSENLRPGSAPGDPQTAKGRLLRREGADQVSYVPKDGFVN